MLVNIIVKLVQIGNNHDVVLFIMILFKSGYNWTIALCKEIKLNDVTGTKLFCIYIILCGDGHRLCK